ncbi:MAG: glycosyltransferase family 2 protein, partial [Actinobacteria bacterium]|nr:glycosyltransferase family 2 protein [Actinomycetota bacterium]
GAARNTGLNAARGEIVTFLDDDNTMHRNWLKSVVVSMETSDGCGLVVGAQIVMPEGGDQGLPSLRFPVRFDWPALTRYNYIDMAMVAHRPRDLRFDEYLPAFVDWDYVVRLTMEESPLLIPAISGVYETGAPARVSHGDRGTLLAELQNRFALLAGPLPRRPESDHALTTDDCTALGALIKRKSALVGRPLEILVAAKRSISSSVPWTPRTAKWTMFETPDPPSTPRDGFDLIFVDRTSRPIDLPALLSEDGLIVGIDGSVGQQDLAYPGLEFSRLIGDGLWIAAKSAPDLATVFPGSTLVKLAEQTTSLSDSETLRPTGSERQG